MDGNLHSNVFIQIRPWEDCKNNCTFCYLKHFPCRKTSTQQKKLRLKKTQDFFLQLKPERIGLIGGEFFEGQLQGCESEWFDLLNAFSHISNEIYITANLIHEQYLLKETIEKLQRKLIICTSYDQVGRFHSKEEREAWFRRVDLLHKECVNVFCTCIATQDFFQASYELPAWLDVNLCDPHISPEWSIEVDKQNYNANLIAANECFNLPKRQSAVRWLSKHMDVAKRYVHYKADHSDALYAFDANNNMFAVAKERLESDYFINEKCGHPHFCQCYADSKKCMMCDAEAVVKSGMLTERA